MSLEDEIKRILADFENASPDAILDVLGQIKPHFKNKLISEYLDGKIQKIRAVGDDDAEKKKLCKALTPYLDWYLQGL